MDVRVQLLQCVRTMHGTIVTIERKFEEKNEENGVILRI